MKQVVTLFILGILSPLIALASGGDVLEWMWIEFFVLFAFAFAIVVIKLNWLGKGMMILIFIATQYVTMKLTDDLPYAKNKMIVNGISILVPAVTTVISYWILKLKFAKRTD